MNGAPTTAKMPASSTNTVRGGSTSGSTARSASATYIAGSTMHEVGRAHQHIVARRRRRNRRRPPTAAPMSIAPSAASDRQPERHARAEQQPAEDVAAEAVGAEQQQRRLRARPTIAPGGRRANHASGTALDRSCS